MPLPTPTFSDGYALTTAHEVSRTVFNAILGDIKMRLADLQSVVVSYEAIEQAGIDASIAAITDSIAPQLQQLSDEMSAIQALIVVAEGQLLALQNAGVDAENISISDSVGLGTGLNLEEALTALKNYADDVAAALGATKLSVSAKATQAEAEAGSLDTVYMTPARVLDAIVAFTPASKTILTTSQSWEKPTTGAAKWALVWLIGAGGGGGRTGNSYTGKALGGMPGESVFWLFPLSALPSSVTVTIGAGGAGTNAEFASGAAGGNTTFGTLLTARGGLGGIGDSGNLAMVPWGFGGGRVASPSSLTSVGGTFGSGANNQISGAQPSAPLGPTAGGSADGSTLRAPGVSGLFGSGGAAAASGSAASNGNAPGGGGGAAAGFSGLTPASGTGARGECQIWLF